MNNDIIREWYHQNSKISLLREWTAENEEKEQNENFLVCYYVHWTLGILLTNKFTLRPKKLIRKKTQ